MSTYGKLDPVQEDRTQFAFKEKRGPIAKVNIPNLFYQNQHIDNEWPCNSKNNNVLPETVKITFNLDIESKHILFSTTQEDD